MDAGLAFLVQRNPSGPLAEHLLTTTIPAFLVSATLIPRILRLDRVEGNLAETIANRADTLHCIHSVIHHEDSL